MTGLEDVTNTNCCECVRSVRDKITLELDAIWTHLRRLEQDARIGPILKTLVDRLVTVLLTFMLVVVPIIIVVIIEYVLQDAKEPTIKKFGRTAAACLVGVGSLIGVPLFLIHMERFVQARSELDLLIPQEERSGQWVNIENGDRGARGDRHPSSEDEWESDGTDSAESWSAVEVAEIAGEVGEGSEGQAFHNYD